MNEEIASGDINRACHYIARLVGEGGSMDIIFKQLSLQYFEYFMSSEVFCMYGVYPIKFVLCRISRFKTSSSSRVSRSILIELASFACLYFKNTNRLDTKLCQSRNTKELSETELEKVVTKELRETIESGNRAHTNLLLVKAIRQLLSNNTSTKIRLWMVIEKYSRNSQIVDAIRDFTNYISSIVTSSNKKIKYELIAVLRSIDTINTDIQTTIMYKPVIFQCALKSELLFRKYGVVSLKHALYTSCLYYEPRTGVSEEISKRIETCEKADELTSKYIDM